MSKRKVIAFSGKAEHGKDECVRILKHLLGEQGKTALAIGYGDHFKSLARQYLEIRLTASRRRKMKSN